MSSDGYVRRLTLFDATMVLIGGIIGGGIFLNPAIVAQRVHTAPLVLATWVLGGAIALAGALCFAELGARRPDAGGGYVYLRDTMGPLAGFLYGWTFLFVINTGGAAAVAVLFAHYATDLLGVSASYTAPLAVGSIVVLTIVNYVGIRPGSITQNIFTVLKLLALAAVVGAGVLHGTYPLHTMPGEPTVRSDVGIIRLLGIALIPVLFSYGGWAHTNNVAGEIFEPGRNLPRAMILGIIVVIAAYVLANVAYLRVLGAAGLAASAAPASDTMRSAIGPIGGTLIGAGIVASTFGFVNLCVLSGPRVLQAMASDGLFFGWAGRLHPRYRTPAYAILFHSAWTIVLTLSGTYGQLLDYVVFGDWIFFGLIAATIFVYRQRDARQPDAPRPPYRVPAYPLLPALFVLVAAFTVVSSVLSNPRNSLIGACIIAGGVPVFWFWHRRHETA